MWRYNVFIKNCLWGLDRMLKKAYNDAMNKEVALVYQGKEAMINLSKSEEFTVVSVVLEAMNPTKVKIKKVWPENHLSGKSKDFRLDLNSSIKHSRFHTDFGSVSHQIYVKLGEWMKII